MLSFDGDLLLRPIAEDDLEFVCSLRNDLVLERAAGREPAMPRTTAEFRAKLQAPETRRAPSDGSTNSIEFICTTDHTPIGIGGLYTIDLFARHAEVGVTFTAGPWRGRGLGTAAHRLLIEYGLYELNLRRVLASVHADNAAVINLCLKLGFTEEGRRKEYRWCNGRYVDLVLFSLGRSDYAFARDLELG